MQTLSKGYKKPDPGDTGDIVFPAIQGDIQQLNDHDHDGVTSELLFTTTQNILAANWVSAPVGGGLFRQLVTLPVGFLYDAIEMSFRLSSGEFVYPSIERVSASTYYIYCNDSSLAMVGRYR